MLHFKNNFFFVKFVVLFFVIVLFGYWGIDLNSEEVYIAFSFFFLCILGFVSLRVSLLSFFVGLANKRYAHIVKGGLFVLLTLRAVEAFWEFSVNTVLFVSGNYKFFVQLVVGSFFARLRLFSIFANARFLFLKSILNVVAEFFFTSVFNMSKNLAFSFITSRLFFVKI